MRSVAKGLVAITATATITLGVAGCGGAAKKSDHPAGSGSPSSGPTQVASSATKSLDAEMKKIRAAVTDSGGGVFAQRTETIAGQASGSANGTFALAGDLQGNVVIRDAASGNKAHAKIRFVAGSAYLQVREWKPAVRSCWLKTTPDKLSSMYDLDVVENSVPIGVNLINHFAAQSRESSGIYLGSLPIDDLVPMLDPGLKDQIRTVGSVKGNVSAYLTKTATGYTVTVPGYIASKELSNALHVDETKLASMNGFRYSASVGPGTAATVSAPSANEQMTLSQLRKNRCG